MRRNRPSLLALLVGLLLGTAEAHAQSATAGPPQKGHAALYRVQRIETFGGDESSALDINDQGQVVGYATNAQHQTRAFLWQDGVLQNLGTLPGDAESWASAINERGDVGGTSRSPQNDQLAWYWSQGQLNPIGTLGGAWSSVFDLNATKIVGWSLIPNAGTRFHGFTFDAGGLTDHGNWPGGIYGQANAIDSKERIVGFSQANPSRWAATIYEQGEGLWLLPDLGGHGLKTFANDINDRGLIVGWSEDGSVYFDPRINKNRFANHAVCWRHGVLQDLGTLGGPSSAALGVNEKDQIVGWADVAPGKVRAALWQQGEVEDLTALIPEDSGWVLTAAFAINEDGQIVGVGEWNGKTRGFVLTPVR